MSDSSHASPGQAAQTNWKEQDDEGTHDTQELGDDELSGGTGRDRMFGLNGDDTFFALKGGRDVIKGGKGFDEARYDRALDRIRSIEAKS